MLAGSGDDLRRGRILDAMVLVAYERGYAGASTTMVCERAKVSRHTFHEHFDDLQECFTAVLDAGARNTTALLSHAFERESSWLAGIRGALVALLTFLDAEPALAHVLLVEAGAAGPWARERREHHVARHVTLIEERWHAHRDLSPHPLVNSGVVASLLGLLQAHLVRKAGEPLLSLLGPLMGVATAPYLDRAEVAREIEDAERLAREMLAGHESSMPLSQIELPELIKHPRARRARACIAYLAAHPAASNRQIARAVGIGSDTQVATLLARLARNGLLSKQPARAGYPNSWSLSARGLQVADALRAADRQVMYDSSLSSPVDGVTSHTREHRTDVRVKP
jgi:AcrR family transcriptional regulator